VALAPAPEGKKPLGWCGGWAWIIPSGARHPNEAWDFMKYLASKRSYQIRADAKRQMSLASGNVFIPDISARIDITLWAMEHYLYNDPAIEDKFKIAKRTFVDAMPFSKYRPVTPIGQLLWNCQVRAMDGGIYKKYDPADVRRNAKLSCDLNAAVAQKELDRIYKPKSYPILSWTPVVGGYIAILIAFIIGMYVYFGRRMQARGYFRREFYAGYLFASPWFLGFLIFGGGPIVFSLFMSFCEYDVLSPPKFVGLNNYVTMFADDPLFYKSLWNTLFMAMGIPLGMLVSLGIAHC